MIPAMQMHEFTIPYEADPHHSRKCNAGRGYSDTQCIGDLKLFLESNLHYQSLSLKASFVQMDRQKISFAKRRE